MMACTCGGTCGCSASAIHANALLEFSLRVGCCEGGASVRWSQLIRRQILRDALEDVDNRVLADTIVALAGEADK
jgi:hypothetical protein